MKNKVFFYAYQYVGHGDRFQRVHYESVVVPSSVDFADALEVLHEYALSKMYSIEARHEWKIINLNFLGFTSKKSDFKVDESGKILK